MSIQRVGIGEYAISGNGDEIKTFALGSCVALIVYDTELHLAAMMHIALPELQINPKKAETTPGYFADSGVPLLLSKLKKEGCTRRTIRIKLAGGSNIMDAQGRFDIGKRNVLAIKKLLWKHRLGVIAEDVGGSISRTVSICATTGTVLISNKTNQWEL